MKVLIELSPEHHSGLLNKCRDTWLVEYNILKEAIPLQQDEPRVGVLCAEYQARNLLVIARALQSPAVTDIMKALGFRVES